MGEITKPNRNMKNMKNYQILVYVIAMMSYHGRNYWNNISKKTHPTERQAPNVAVSTAASFQPHTVDEKSFTTWAFVSHLTGCHPACCIIQVPLQRETKAWPHQWHMTTASVKTYGIDWGQANHQKQRNNVKYDGKHVLFRIILWANFEIPRDFWRDLARFDWTQHQLRLANVYS